MVPLFDLIITLAAAIVLIVASIADLRTREIPDWVSYSLLSFVFITRIVEALVTHSWGVLIQSFIGFLVFFGIGNAMYYSRQWGGGDTKVLTAIGTAFAKRPDFIPLNSFLPFGGVLLINILISGAIYGTAFAAYLGLKNWPAFAKEFKKINSLRKIRSVKVAMLSIMGALVLFTFTNLPTEVKFILLKVVLFLVLLPYIFIMIKSVENACMYKNIAPKELTEGDWVQNDVVKGKKVLYKADPYGIDKDSIERLIKAKIQAVSVKEGVPFIPSFLIGTVITLILGEVIFFPGF